MNYTVCNCLLLIFRAGKFIFAELIIENSIPILHEISGSNFMTLFCFSHNSSGRFHLDGNELLCTISLSPFSVASLFVHEVFIVVFRFIVFCGNYFPFSGQKKPRKNEKWFTMIIPRTFWSSFKAQRHSRSFLAGELKLNLPIKLVGRGKKDTLECNKSLKFSSLLWEHIFQNNTERKKVFMSHKYVGLFLCFTKLKRKRSMGKKQVL